MFYLLLLNIICTWLLMDELYWNIGSGVQQFLQHRYPFCHLIPPTYCVLLKGSTATSLAVLAVWSVKATIKCVVPCFPCWSIPPIHINSYIYQCVYLARVFDTHLFIYIIYTNQTGCLCRRMLGTYSVHILPTCHVQFNNMYATWMVVEIFGSCVKIHALQACGKS